MEKSHFTPALFPSSKEQYKERFKKYLYITKHL